VNVGKGGFYADPHKTLLMMADLACDILVTTPSWAIQLLETAAQNGIGVGQGTAIQPRIIWLTGEGCSDAFRKRLEVAWGAPCLMYYGSLECGPLGNECVVRDGYHLPEGHIYVEIVDAETGEVLPEGRVGEICVTVLYRRAMPLIRYRLQDTGYLDSEPCACCLERPRLFLRGRVQDQIRLGDHDFSPTRLEEFLYRIPEVGNSYQFHVEDDCLSVVAEINPQYGKSPEIEEKIRCALECVAGQVSSVTLVDKIPSGGGKVTRVIRRSKP
jgi:phenylacetate-CoA ligase